MNITLPKPQNTVAAFDQVCITPFITVFILSLNGIEILKFARVAMPEISIPLNNQSGIRDENIDNKFSTNHLLLFKQDGQTQKQIASGIFKFCRLAVRNVGQYFTKVGVGGIGMIITASMRTITNGEAIKPPSWYIEWLITGFTSDDFSSPTNGGSTLPCLFFSFSIVLPFVCAIQRAKTHNAVFSGKENGIAPLASVCTTGITPLRDIRGWSIWFMASLANLLFSNICIHVLIIPCQIGGVK